MVVWPIRVGGSIVEFPTENDGITVVVVTFPQSLKGSRDIEYVALGTTDQHFGQVLAIFVIMSCKVQRVM